VDSAAYEHFDKNRQELGTLFSEERPLNVLFLVLGNEIDIAGAVSEEELRYHLGLTHTTGKVTEQRAVPPDIVAEAFILGF